MSIREISSILSGLGRSLFFTFTMDDHADDTFKVVDFSIEEGLSTPFTLQLTLASYNSHLTDSDVVDKSGCLTLYRHQQVERYFHGVVFSFSIGDIGRHHSFYRITLVPAFSRLSLRTNSRIFQNMSVVEITEVLLEEMGISDYGLALRHPHEAREYCVQYCESDLDFIERLLAEEGIFYYFEHRENKHTLILADDNSVVYDLPFPCLYNNLSGGLAETTYIRRLESVSRVKPTSAVLNDYTFLHPRAHLRKISIGNNMEYQNDYEYYIYPGRYKDHEIGEAFTQSRINHLRSDAKTIKGEGNIGQLTSGYMMTLEDHPTINPAQRWLLTKVKHTGLQPQSLETEGGEGMTEYHNTFYAVPSQQPWKAAPKIKPRIYGPHIAKVVGPSDEEIYTDQYGRVKVQFPWDRYGEEDERSSCWIRVAQEWAGAHYGGVVLPRIGHEVIVSFLEGDPDQPIITGRAYHATQRHPYALPTLKTLASLKSKEYKASGYGELLLDDTKGEIKTQLQSTHGTSQLTMGYLTHPRKHDGTGEHRGDGFELRSDEWGAIRAGKGLYISTQKREKAAGKQLDIEESIAQLEHALYVAREIQKAAAITEQPLNDVEDQETQLNETYQELKDAGMLLHSPKGIALTSQESIQTSSRKHLVSTAGDNIELNAYKNVQVGAKDKVSLLAIKEEMKLVTNHGEMIIQSQNNELELLAKDELSIQSTDERVLVTGEKEIVLSAGGSQIKINEGGITLITPGKFEVKSASQNFNGPQRVGVDTRGFPLVDPKIYKEKFRVLLPSGEPLDLFDYKLSSEEDTFISRFDEDGQTREVYTEEEEELDLEMTWIELEKPETEEE